MSDQGDLSFRWNPFTAGCMWLCWNILFHFSVKRNAYCCASTSSPSFSYTKRNKGAAEDWSHLRSFPNFTCDYISVCFTQDLKGDLASQHWVIQKTQFLGFQLISDCSSSLTIPSLSWGKDHCASSDSHGNIRRDRRERKNTPNWSDSSCPFIASSPTFSA